MSLILDALRKIEQERRTRRQGSMDIRADVLNYHGRTPPPKNRLVPLAGLTLIAIIAAALFFFFKRESPSVAGEQAAPTTGIDRPAAVTPELPAPAREPASLPKAAGVPPVHAPPQPATAAPSVDETMVISGIAWQEERGMRRAVVNGVLAAEGGEILGARIVEIREDRVLFSRNGRNFEALYAGGAGR